MSDLIARQAAIDALCEEYCNGHHDCKYYPRCENLRWIQELPSAQSEITEDAINDAHNEGYDVGYWAGRRDYEPKWIPVTERLPEEDKYVLVSTEDNDIDIARYDYNEWCEDPEIEWWNGEYRVFPTAWMPLPELYKEREVDDAEIHN